MVSCQTSQTDTLALVLNHAPPLRLDASLPHRRSYQGGEASSWALFRGTREVWTYSFPFSEAFLQGRQGERVSHFTTFRFFCNGVQFYPCKSMLNRSFPMPLIGHFPCHRSACTSKTKATLFTTNLTFLSSSNGTGWLCFFCHVDVGGVGGIATSTHLGKAHQSIC